MKKLSLCMIVKNEETSLPFALENASEFADEIIIVDTGSQDNTKQVARKYTDKVYDFEWIDDFSKARNFSFEKASYPYIMWLDADDFLTDESIEGIKEFKEKPDEIDVLMCPYVASYDEKMNPIFEYMRERIVKNSKKLRWHDRVHEVIIPTGAVKTNEKIKIYHKAKEKTYTDRNLKIYEDMIKKGEYFSPRSQFYYARELMFNGRISEAIHELSKFIAEDKGWVENKIEACLNLAKCYQEKKDYKNALISLLGSFIYSSPRSEIIYEIGQVFMKMNDFETAIYWFKLALNSTNKGECGAFVNLETTTFLPAIQLCVCYDKINKFEESYYYHKLSKKYRPNDECVKKNDIYFKSKKNTT